MLNAEVASFSATEFRARLTMQTPATRPSSKMRKPHLRSALALIFAMLPHSEYGTGPPGKELMLL